MSLLDRFRQKKEDPEAKRRNLLLQKGRISEGTVLDTFHDSAGNMMRISYRYTVSGVDYESNDPLSPDQRQHSSDYFPGARIIIRYDPHQPANSVVV